MKKEITVLGVTFYFYEKDGYVDISTDGFPVSEPHRAQTMKTMEALQAVLLAGQCQDDREMDAINDRALAHRSGRC